MSSILLFLRSLGSLVGLAVIVLSSLGIYLLCATKPLNNNKILLINLALSGIVSSAVQIVSSYLNHYLTDAGKILIVQKISATSANAYYFAIYLLTADRLIATLNPLKYRIFVTKKRLKRVIIASWSLILILEISFFLSTEWFKLFDKHMWVTYDIIFAILCFTTYGLIFLKIRSRRWFNNDKKFFKITSLIVLSFIIFILVPNILFHLYAYKYKALLEFLVIMWLTGMMVDPIIYIFLQPDLRSLLKDKFCRRNIEEPSLQQETAL